MDDLETEEIQTLDKFEQEFKEPDLEEANFTELANLRVGQDPVGDTFNLGQRPIDLEADWTPFLGQYINDCPILYDSRQTYWKSLKEQASITIGYSTQPSLLRRSLNAKQRLLFDTFRIYYKDFLQTGNEVQLLVNCNGKAGTGKSFVIKQLSATLEGLQKAAFPLAIRSPVVRLALTGSAAFRIQGYTLHSMFRFLI